MQLDMVQEPALSLTSIRSMIAEVRGVIEDAENTIRSARERLDDLLLAESVFSRLLGNTKVDEAEAQGDGNPAAGFRLKAISNPYKAGTNKAYFFQVLEEASSVWLTANEVQEKAKKLKGMDIPMGSVSPGLTEMKDDGFVVRVGLKVALKTRLQENEASTGETEDASEAGEPELSPEQKHLLVLAAASA